MLRERDDLSTGIAALHGGSNPRRRSVGDGAHRIGREMSVALGRTGLLVPEHLSDHKKSVPVCHREGRERVSQIMQP